MGHVSYNHNFQMAAVAQALSLVSRSSTGNLDKLGLQQADAGKQRRIMLGKFLELGEGAVR